jgi:hypothetical protein
VLIDVRHWTKRTLDEHASQFTFSAGTLLAYGTSWNSATQKTTGIGLTAYGLDGEKRFHLFEEEPIYYVETAGPYAYVWRNGEPPVTVDLRSGSVIRELLATTRGISRRSWCREGPVRHDPRNRSMAASMRKSGFRN